MTGRWRRSARNIDTRDRKLNSTSVRRRRVTLHCTSYNNSLWIVSCIPSFRVALSRQPHESKQTHRSGHRCAPRATGSRWRCRPPCSRARSDQFAGRARWRTSASGSNQKWVCAEPAAEEKEDEIKKNKTGESFRAEVDVWSLLFRVYTVKPVVLNRSRPVDHLFLKVKSDGPLCCADNSWTTSRNFSGMFCHWFMKLSVDHVENHNSKRLSSRNLQDFEANAKARPPPNPSSLPTPRWRNIRRANSRQRSASRRCSAATRSPFPCRARTGGRARSRKRAPRRRARPRRAIRLRSGSSWGRQRRHCVENRVVKSFRGGSRCWIRNSCGLFRVAAKWAPRWPHLL